MLQKRAINSEKMTVKLLNLLAIIIFKTVAIKEAKAVIKTTKNEHLTIQQFVDASSPSN
jgi:hypothetical protein